MFNRIMVNTGGKWAEFHARPGDDKRHTDKIVVDEIFRENVYQIDEGMFDDTGIVLDIGANIGAFTAFVMLMGAKKVIAYEPDTENADMFVRNMELNSINDYKLVRKGVGFEDETKELWHAQGGSFVFNDALTGVAKEVMKDPDATTEKVQLINFASVFTDNNIIYCDVLKVDIEGSEYALFEGVDSEVIKKCRYICVEFNNVNHERFGLLVAKLGLTHNLHIIGSYETGGMIYGRRYE